MADGTLHACEILVGTERVVLDVSYWENGDWDELFRSLRNARKTGSSYIELPHCSIWAGWSHYDSCAFTILSEQGGGFEKTVIRGHHEDYDKFVKDLEKLAEQMSRTDQKR